VLESNKTYKPFERALHVCEEANRVLRFKEICESNLTNDSKASILGHLMNES